MIFRASLFVLAVAASVSAAPAVTEKVCTNSDCTTCPTILTSGFNTCKCSSGLNRCVMYEGNCTAVITKTWDANDCSGPPSQTGQATNYSVTSCSGSSGTFLSKGCSSSPASMLHPEAWVTLAAMAMATRL